MLQITAAERRDLEAIARAWDLPLGVCGYALLADALARCRSRSANLGDIGLALAAADATLRRDLRSALAEVRRQLEGVDVSGEGGRIVLNLARNSIRVVVEPPELSP